jgi:hypothetical protein
LVACDHRFENRFPRISAMHIATTRYSSPEVFVLMEDEDRAVAGSDEMSLPGALQGSPVSPASSFQVFPSGSVMLLALSLSDHR